MLSVNWTRASAQLELGGAGADRARHKPPRLISRFSCFGKDRSGGTAIATALCIVILTASVGGAIDYGRWLQAKTQTQNALDAAILAASQILQTEPNETSKALQAAQRAYLTMRAQTTKLDETTFEIPNSGGGVRANGFAKMATPFLATIGIPELEINLSSETSFGGGGSSGSNIELSIMLDVTGSMCDDNVGPCRTGRKINALKAAARDLVNIVVWQDQSRWTSKVALVPFSTRVRVAPDRGGGAMMRLLTDLPSRWSGWYNECVESTGGGGSEGGGNWRCTRYEARYKTDWDVMPCVTDRTGPQEYTDAAPGTGAWLNAHDGSRRLLSYSSIDEPLTSKRGNSSGDPAEHWNFTDWGDCADVAQRNEIMPLTSDKSRLEQRVNDLEAYGATGGALGTAWSWYMLSDRWAGVWTGNSRPAPYSELTELGPTGRPKLRKVAVLMSDGVYNTFRGWKEASQSTVSARAKRICTEMKAKGIEIYSVAFDLDSLPAGERAIAEDTLKSCGSTLSHFYQSLTVDDLKTAFRDIALKLSTVRITR